MNGAERCDDKANNNNSERRQVRLRRNKFIIHRQRAGLVGVLSSQKTFLPGFVACFICTLQLHSSLRSIINRSLLCIIPRKIYATAKSGACSDCVNNHSSPLPAAFSPLASLRPSIVLTKICLNSMHCRRVDVQGKLSA
jgi:hypothetical protein